jgi:hypothetical protein
MQPSHLLLAQALSLSGLVAACGAYAGLIRRRRDRRTELQATTDASTSAVSRIERSMALSHIDHTFSRSAYRRQDSASRDR